MTAFKAMAPRTASKSLLDQIGPWTEIKLEIVKEYAVAYSKILKANQFHHLYIDAFSGAGLHISRTTGKFVRGSPLNALLVDPPFQEYHFIDLNSKKNPEKTGRPPSEH